MKEERCENGRKMPMKLQMGGEKEKRREEALKRGRNTASSKLAHTNQRCSP
jgi:hypothetical protein